MIVFSQEPRITNRHGLPEAFVNAVSKHTHKGADISATGLKLSPRQFWLSRRHADEITEDVSDRIWSLWGTTFHAIMEDGEDDTLHRELYCETEIAGKKLSGTIDRVLKDGSIEDWKTTSVFTVMYGSSIEDWTVQLNVYAYLLKIIHGIDSPNLSIWAMMRDHRTGEIEKFGERYPISPVKKIPIEKWTNEVTEKFIKDRINDIFAHETTPDADLPKCTKDQVWWNDKKKIPNKCPKYCNGRDFCNQYQGFVKAEKHDD